MLGRAGEYTSFAGERIHQPQDITETHGDGHGDRRRALGEAATPGSTGSPTCGRRGWLAARAAQAGIGGHAAVGQPGPAPTLNCGMRHGGLRRRLARRTGRTGDAQVPTPAGGLAAGMIGRAVTQIAVANSAGCRPVRGGDRSQRVLTFDRRGRHRPLGRICIVPSDALDAAEFDRRPRWSVPCAAGAGSPCPTAEFTVVLGPQAAGELVGFLPDFGFSGELAAAGVGCRGTAAGSPAGFRSGHRRRRRAAPVGLPIRLRLPGHGQAAQFHS